MKKVKLSSVFTALLVSVSIALTGCAHSEEIQQDEQTGEATVQQEQSSDTSADSGEQTSATQKEQSTSAAAQEEQTSETIGSEEQTSETVSSEEQTAATAATTTITAAPTTTATTTTAAATTTTTTTTTTKPAAATTTAAVTTTTTAAATTTKQEQQPPASSTAGVAEIRNMTTMQLVHDMGQGINLGNTLESCGDWINSSGGVRAYETAWGSPAITKQMIQGYADLGFGVLRIPVAWSNLMAADYTISQELMDRVKQIVDWTLESGMYAIVNIHWDGGWFEKFPTDYDECMKKYTRIWEQISKTFRNYGDKLMFESLNEEGAWDSVWNRYSGSGDKAKAYGILNDMNQQFVNIVRASGGNNIGRHLLIAGYNTDITLTCDSQFKMPNDPSGRCAVSVHYYTPATFCLLDKDESWGKAKETWGTDGELKELQKNMNQLKTTFIDKGIPVIIGEYSVAAKGNKEKAQIENFMVTVTEAIFNIGACPVIWDVQKDHYNRSTCQFIYPDMLKRIMDIKASHA